MAIVRVQVRKQLAGAPSIGNWDVYSGAWFETGTVVPSAGVQTLLSRMFVGAPPAGSGIPVVLNTAPFVLTGNGSDLKVWERVAGVSTQVFAGLLTVPTLTPGGTPAPALPSQCACSVGYKATVTGNRQRGRSRWFLGPLLSNTAYIVDTTNGGPRFATSAVDFLADAAAACLSDLTALGWVLQVKSGEGPGEEFNPADELYVDDRFDTQRSRSSWVTHQERRNL